MKSKTHLITAACAAALIGFGPALAFAAPKKSSSPAPAASPAASAAASPMEKAPRAIPFRGTASSVDQSAKTFAIVGKENTRTFKATDKTTVTKEGSAASFSDLADSEKVTGSYWKQADGTLELKSLKLGGAAAATEKATPSKKSKKTEEAATEAAATPSPSKKK